jgi:hypothetical protein
MPVCSSVVMELLDRNLQSPACKGQPANIACYSHLQMPKVGQLREESGRNRRDVVVLETPG